MTAKRDSKRQPKSAERPKLKKETVKDLEPPAKGSDQVKAGHFNAGNTRNGC
jgi:hypothetical protein